MFGLSCFMLLYMWFVFYTPNYLGHADNYIPANPGVTPSHIVPEWYYLPFYAILRAIPNKLGGVVAMFGAIVILAFLPWLDTARTRSARYRPLFKQFFWIFAVVCVVLGWLGSKPAEGAYVIIARILTIYYFAHFIIILPLLSRIETPRTTPNSIADDVLARTGSLKKPMVSTAIATIAVAGALLFSTAQPASAAESVQPPRQKWSFAGPFGKYDRAQLQRGFQVYKEVCATCHGLSYVAFRNLAEPGGPGYSTAQAAAAAAEWQQKVKDGPNDQGEMFERAARPADRFPAPFPNDQAARLANGGALPPDLSLVAKARTYERGFPWFIFDIFTQYQEQGPDYLVALMNGYENAPQGFTLPAGSHYNKYFPGHSIGMPKPLNDGQVTYSDGSPQTVDQYAKDVTAFLMWAAEPHMEARKRIGFQVFIFLILLCGMLYFTKKKVWAEAH
jgi:ubiquinol-cytochrome c reductase cytochrome b/c1 subunit